MISPDSVLRDGVAWYSGSSMRAFFGLGPVEEGIVFRFMAVLDETRLAPCFWGIYGAWRAKSLYVPKVLRTKGLVDKHVPDDSLEASILCFHLGTQNIRGCPVY